MGLKGPCCAAASLGHLRRIMWLNRPVNSGHKRREESFSPLHNAPNEVAGGSVIPGWALCSLFTICLMTERGLPSAPVLSNEPQREITGSIVARHRSLALIRPNKPVSSQGRTHPSAACPTQHTPSVARSVIMTSQWHAPITCWNTTDTLSHYCLYLYVDTGITSLFFSLGHRCCVYCSANNVWVCICIHWVFTCPPFCLHFKQGRSSWPVLPPAAPAKRMQMSMSTMAPTAAHSRPKTEDKAAVPFIRNPWSPLSDTSCSPQHWSPPNNHVASQPRYPLPTAFLYINRQAFGQSRICSDILLRDSHTSTLSVALELLLGQSEKGNVGKSKQLVSFFFLHTFRTAFPLWSLFGQNYCAEQTRTEGGRREEGYPKREG